MDFFICYSFSYSSSNRKTISLRDKMDLTLQIIGGMVFVALFSITYPTIKSVKDDTETQKEKLYNEIKKIKKLSGKKFLDAYEDIKKLENSSIGEYAKYSFISGFVSIIAMISTIFNQILPQVIQQAMIIIVFIGIPFYILYLIPVLWYWFFKRKNHK